MSSNDYKRIPDYKSYFQIKNFKTKKYEDYSDSQSMGETHMIEFSNISDISPYLNENNSFKFRVWYTNGFAKHSMAEIQYKEQMYVFTEMVILFVSS